MQGALDGEYGSIGQPLAILPPVPSGDALGALTTPEAPRLAIEGRGVPLLDAYSYARMDYTFETGLLAWNSPPLPMPPVVWDPPYYPATGGGIHPVGFPGVLTVYDCQTYRVVGLWWHLIEHVWPGGLERLMTSFFLDEWP